MPHAPERIGDPAPDIVPFILLLALIVSAFAMAGCGPRVITKDRIETVSVPVIQKCAAEKPATVTALRDRIDAAAWDALSLKQKAETASAQALRRLNYSEALTAATSAC